MWYWRKVMSAYCQIFDLCHVQNQVQPECLFQLLDYLCLVTSRPLGGRLRVRPIRLSVRPSVCPVHLLFTEQADPPLCRCGV